MNNKKLKLYLIVVNTENEIIKIEYLRDTTGIKIRRKSGFYFVPANNIQDAIKYLRNII